MDDAVTFFVEGAPKTAGSKVSGVAHRKTTDGGYEPVLDERTGKLKTFTKDSSGEPGKAWRQDVRDAARRAMAGRPPLDGPLTLTVTFQRARNKGHYGTGRNARLLKPSAPAYPIVRPDVSKMLRAVEDAMLSIVFADDSQIVELSARKEYSDDGREGARVSVTKVVLGTRINLALDLTEARSVWRLADP